MKLVRTDLPKLCHANLGDLVQLCNEPGELQPEHYMVCAFSAPNMRPARVNMMHGLYDDERPLFLVNVVTGEARKMVHLSERVKIIRDAEIVITEDNNHE